MPQQQRGQGEQRDLDGGATSSVFEQIRHETEEGGEYWSARELTTVLGYTRWEQFPGVIAKAQDACQRVHHACTTTGATETRAASL